MLPGGSKLKSIFNLIITSYLAIAVILMMRYEVAASKGIFKKLPKIPEYRY
jgi:hypothetical protein